MLNRCITASASRPRWQEPACPEPFRARAIRHDMKSILLTLLGLAVVAVHSQQEPRNTTKDAMRFKLYFAQGVLEGITTENFSFIATNAQKLKGLSQSADWKIRSTREYQRLT